MLKLTQGLLISFQRVTVGLSWSKGFFLFLLSSLKLPNGNIFFSIAGAELHLARELESEDYIDVKVDSDEDIFAIKAYMLTLF